MPAAPQETLRRSIGSTNSSPPSARITQPVDVKWFGAVGDGVADDTAAIMAAITAAGLAVQTIQPVGSSQLAAVPTVLFLAGIYKITAPLTFLTTGLSYVRLLGDGQAIITQATAATDIIDFRGSLRLQVEGITFNGGARQFLWGNNNVNGSRVLFTRCQFHNSTDWAIETTLTGSWGTVGNMSANVIVRDCHFNNCNRILKNVAGVATKVVDSWVEVVGPTMADGALFENRDELLFDNMYGVPPDNSTPTLARWVDNYGQFFAVRSRFGGEDSGMSIVWNYAGPQVVYPYNLGGVVSIKNSFCSSGPNIGRLNALINLATAVPQLIEITGNFGITQDANPWIADNIAGGAAAYIATNFTGNVYGHLRIEDNVGHQPFGATKLPAALTESANIYVNGKKLTTVASAGSLTIPVGAADFLYVTGTTNIDTIVATGRSGQVIVLNFADILTVGDGTGNLVLAGNFTTSANDQLTLFSNGTSWIEIARSVN